MHLANRLLDLRRAAQMTQRQVAESVGVNRTTVCRWEAGAVPIPDRHKVALAALFGVSAAHLMCWDAPQDAAA